MRKKIIIVTIVIISIVLGTYFGILAYKDYQIRHAKIEVILKDDLSIEFGEEKKISDFIVSINGDKILNDKKIAYEKIGKQEVSFSYINDDHIKVSYTFEVNIKDTIEPFVWLGKTYRVEKDEEINLIEKIQYGDNYDSHPKCVIEGTYDLAVVGKYPLTFVISDSSGNIYRHEFILDVYEPTSEEPPKEITYLDFEQIKKDYKTEKTKIGLDVSGWQGDIDFEKIKEAGVEFLFIRVGSKSSPTEYFVDKKFERNITLAQQYGIPVGIYYYSYAGNEEEARDEAKWVIKQIKDYKIDLPVVFDWEEWNNFNFYRVSFYELTNIAKSFLEEIEEAGYQGMLYSSKNYLENVWYKTKYDVWLAHYTNMTNYEGEYQYWQMTSSGKIDGIKGPVDVNIFYQ